MRKIGLLCCWLLVICGVLTGCGPQYAGYIDFSKGAKVAAPVVTTLLYMLVFVVAQGLFLCKYMEDKDVTEDK